MKTQTAISRALQVLGIGFLGLVTAAIFVFAMASTAHAGALQGDAGETEFMTSLGSDSDAAIRGVLVTPLADTGKAGDEIQIVTAAIYYGDRVKENVTSCFSCPTPDNFSDGTVSYEIVKGPATMDWSKVVIDADAQIDDEIILQVTYHDNKSDTTGTSMLTLITVGNVSAADIMAQAAEAKRLAEEQRLADIAAAEEQRLAEIAAAEEKRLADIAAAEEQRLAEIAAAEAAAEEKRLADIAASEAEEKRLADIAASEAEEQRLADIAAEEEKLAMEKEKAEQEAALHATADAEEAEEALEQSDIFTLEETKEVEVMEDKRPVEAPVLKAAASPAQRGEVSTIYWVILVLFLLALAALAAKRRMLKIDHKSPEHRALENELYEAFGEKHKDHLPENHDEKESEVHAAFDHMNDENHES